MFTPEYITDGLNPGWVIVTDHDADHNAEAPSNDNAKGMTGPRTYTGGTSTKELPIPFKLYTDDGELVYTGRMNRDAMDAFGEGDPLYNFGAPNYGCTELRYREEGTWRTL